MSPDSPLPFRATLERYQHQAEALLDDLKAGDEGAQWRFKWEHPRFRGRPVAEVRAAALDLADAQVVVAHQYAFETWADLVAFTGAVTYGDFAAASVTSMPTVVAGGAAGLRLR